MSSACGTCRACRLIWTDDPAALSLLADPAARVPSCGRRAGWFVRLFSTDVTNAHSAEDRVVSNRTGAKPKQTPNGNGYMMQVTMASPVPNRYQGLPD